LEEKGAKPSAPEKGEVILTFALHGKNLARYLAPKKEFFPRLEAECV
jgi:hypothetical protein